MDVDCGYTSALSSIEKDELHKAWRRKIGEKVVMETMEIQFQGFQVPAASSSIPMFSLLTLSTLCSKQEDGDRRQNSRKRSGESRKQVRIPLRFYVSSCGIFNLRSLSL